MKSAPKSKPYTLITGASAGLGKALAIECAKHGRHLILAALPQSGLCEFAEYLHSKYNVRIVPVELDLCQYDEIKSFVNSISPQFRINCLINNVGLGCTYCFHEIYEGYIQRIIDLNIRATSILIYHLLPNLMRNERAHIINISSILSQYPVAFKTVYPASKAFIYSLSLGLREELRNSNVTVSVALPGAMLTNEEVSKRLKGQNWLARAAILTPKKAASIILRQSIRGKKVIIPGVINKIFLALMKIVPYRFGIPLLSRIYRQEIRYPADSPNMCPVARISQQFKSTIDEKIPAVEHRKVRFLQRSDRPYSLLARDPAEEEFHEMI